MSIRPILPLFVSFDQVKESIPGTGGGGNGIFQGQWTPAQASAPAQLEVASGIASIDPDNYGFTVGSSGTVVTGNVPFDATRRYHTISFTAMPAGAGESMAFGLVNGTSLGMGGNIYSGQVVQLTNWDPINGWFIEVLIGNPFQGDPVLFNNVAVSAGDELACVVDNTGYTEFFINGVSIGSATDVPMVSDNNRFAATAFSPHIWDGTIVETPVTPPAGATQYTTVGGPIVNYPANRENTLWEIAGLPPEGLASDIGLLTNGVYVLFDQNGNLADQPSIGQHLTKAEADSFYAPFLLNNFSGSGAPTVNDDASQGYSVGSKWIDIVASPHEAYVLTNSSIGNASWQLTTLTIDQLGSAALLDTGTAAGQLPTNSTVDSKIAGAIEWVRVTGGNNVQAEQNKGYVWDGATGTPSLLLPQDLTANVPAFVWLKKTINPSGINVSVSGVPIGGDVNFYINGVSTGTTFFTPEDGITYLFVFDGTRWNVGSTEITDPFPVPELLNLNLSSITNYTLTAADHGKTITISGVNVGGSTITIPNGTLPNGFYVDIVFIAVVGESLSFSNGGTGTLVPFGPLRTPGRLIVADDGIGVDNAHYTGEFGPSWTGSKQEQFRNIKLITNPTYTLLASDINKVLHVQRAGPCTITVPLGLGVGFNCQVIHDCLGQIVQFNNGANVFFNSRNGWTTIVENGMVEVIYTSDSSSAFVQLSGDLQA